MVFQSSGEQSRIKKFLPQSLLLALAATSASSSSSSYVSLPQHLRGRDHDHDTMTQQQQQQQMRQRWLSEPNPDNRYCGSNWQTAHDACDAPCPSALDEDCGPGMYCFGYVDCTPPADAVQSDATSESLGDANAASSPAMPPSEYTPTASNIDQQPSVPDTAPSPDSIPTYIASLPLKPSSPTAPAPFSIPVPPANLLPNPTSNYCGYGWESANAECYYACPSGSDSDCPAGRSCHTWLNCNQADEDPALYNTCGVTWTDASTKCAARCFNGDADCPSGESCFGNVIECRAKLPPLTAEDAGQSPKLYTQDEIDELLIEAKKEEAEQLAMEDPDNWWCGSSWTDMLERCSKRCTSDSDCVVNSWDTAICFKTPGGEGNCAIEGQPAKQASAPGSKWCGRTWNDMLETCSQKCESDDDCPGTTCWDAPNTCQYIGVPVKEVSDPATLWCGATYDDAAVSCHKPCPSENDDDCPEGMSCFAGSSCQEEGVPVVRENYRCGVSWDDAAGNCGAECQKDEDCDGENGEVCYADVECVGEGTAGSSGMMCVSNWEAAQEECKETNTCASDDDCEGTLLCMWVDCQADAEEEAEAESQDNAETTEPPGCNAEVQQCPNGQFVARAPELNCEFYPCPETQTESEEAQGLSDGEEEEDGSQETMVANSQGLENGNPQEDEGGGETTNDSASSEWGTIPLTFASPKCEGECTMCQGDCNSDDDCADDLECFSRGNGERTAVPGCIGGGEGDLPGMDYCYMPEPPTTTTTTTTTETTTVTTTTESMELASADAPQLTFARECSAEEPCNACEGDCDKDTDCAGELLCFSRIQGSVEFVPGCTGMGTAGMDYCYDPDGDIILPPTDATTTTTTATSTPQEELAGCSAEVKVCPGTTIVFYQNPARGCAFDLCPGETASTASSESPDIISTTTESSTEGTTSPDTTTTTIVETTVASGPITCDTLCLTELPAAFCPEGMADLPNCLSIEIGEICEARGECATDDSLNNCQTFDVYVRVECGGETPTQGYLMNNPAVTTESPMTSTSVTIDSVDAESANETNATVTDESMTLNSASIVENTTSAAALLENATSNALEEEPVVINSTVMPENPTSTATTTVATPLESTAKDIQPELNFVRECTSEEPCNACEGDCDLDDHCAAGLVCYRRMRGSVELVPGCTGVGIPGMDFCYNSSTSSNDPLVDTTLETIDSSSNNATGSSSNLTLQMGDENVASAAAASFTYDRNPDENSVPATEESPAVFNYDPSYWESTDTYDANSENYHEGWDLTGYYTPRDSDTAYMNSRGWVVILGALAVLIAAI